MGEKEGRKLIKNGEKISKKNLQKVSRKTCRLGSSLDLMRKFQITGEKLRFKIMIFASSKSKLTKFKQIRADFTGEKIKFMLRK